MKCYYCEKKIEGFNHTSFCSEACENSYSDLSDSLVDDHGETLPCACGKK